MKREKSDNRKIKCMIKTKEKKSKGQNVQKIMES